MKSWCMSLSYFLGLLVALMAEGAVSSSLSEEEATTFVRRHLDQGNYNNNYNAAAAVDTSYFEYDLANFSLRFDRCQYVKMYDDDFAQDEDSDSPLAIKHFAVYRLCPSDSCDGDTCDEGVFGRYVTELEDYLAYTVAEQQSAFEYMCGNCQERCNGDGDYCSGCGKICYHLENLEANGYIDAANYIECQKLEMNYNDDDGNNAGDDGANNENEQQDEDGDQEQQEGDEDENGRRLNDGNDEFQLYIGPRCSSDGSRVLIGLFSDQYCLEPYTAADPVDFLGANISYHYLAHTSSNDGDYCLSCMESDEDNNAEDNADADNVNEMCEDLYAESAKCESKYGLDGFINENRDDGEYENQVENEFMVCNFIESLIWDSYTETGEINLEGDLDVIIREMTGLQKAAVSALALSIVGLIGVAFFLQRQIEKSYPKLDLSCQSADAQLT